MLKIELVGLTQAFNNLTSQLRSEVNLLAGELLTEIRTNTPVDTGKARAGWIKKNSSNGFEISNSVPYVPILDKGRHLTNRGMRGSRQAPNGIIGPSLDSIKRKN